MRRSSWIAAAVGLLIAAGLPVAGHWLRHEPEDRCALEGAPIEATYRVRVVDEAGQSRAFCCIACAEFWLAHCPGRPRAIYVTDEETGREVNAHAAYFVRSPVVTNAGTGNRIHAFGRRAVAVKHAALGGTILEGPDRPFHRTEVRTAPGGE
jgi:hypothetical protein